MFRILHREKDQYLSYHQYEVPTIESMQFGGADSMYFADLDDAKNYIRASVTHSIDQFSQIILSNKVVKGLEYQGNGSHFNRALKYLLDKISSLRVVGHNEDIIRGQEKFLKTQNNKIKKELILKILIPGDITSALRKIPKDKREDMFIMATFDSYKPDYRLLQTCGVVISRRAKPGNDPYGYSDHALTPGYSPLITICSGKEQFLMFLTLKDPKQDIRYYQVSEIFRVEQQWKDEWLTNLK